MPSRSVQESMKELKKATLSHPAHGTLWLASGVFSLWLLVGLSTILGKLPLGLAFAFNTLLTYCSFTLMHEASHGNIRAQKKLKRLELLIGLISGALLTVPFSVFRSLHLTHHAYTNQPERDPDYWVASGNPLIICLKCASIVPAYYYHFVKNWSHQPESRRQAYMIKGLLGFAGIYGLTYLAFHAFGWQILLACWWGPALLATAFLAFAFNWLPHHPHTHQEAYKNTRVLNYPGLQWVLLGQNYHLIHHLHPGLPFYVYHRAYTILEDDLSAQGSLILPGSNLSEPNSL